MYKEYNKLLHIEIMASVNNVSKKRKRRHKWKPVSIDGSCFVADDMDGFVSLEVLDDYEINDESGGKVIKQSKGSLETVKVTDIWEEQSGYSNIYISDGWYQNPRTILPF